MKNCITFVCLWLCITQKDGNAIQYKITLDCNRPEYIVDEYPAIKEFYLKLYAILNEQIVLKKKS